MNWRLLVFFLVFGSLAGASEPEAWRPENSAPVPPAPSIEARSALLFDARSGRVLYRKNENDPMPVASTQKLLTALLVVERGNLEQLVTIAPSDTLAEPTKLYLKAGEKYSRRDLLHAMLIRSPNDVALALARDHSGDVEMFAHAMNRRIRHLGGKVSNFINPNGLPAEGQISTAREIAAVARAAYFQPELREIIKDESFTFLRADGKPITLSNTNRVLRTNPHCNGMKTGYTRLSGHCLISSAAREGHHVIAVVLGSNKAKVWGESSSLLDYGLALLQRDAATATSDRAKSSERGVSISAGMLRSKDDDGG